MTEGRSSAPPHSLAHRHVRVGYWGLLVFLTLGIALEALHAFKLGFYLDVASEPRRLVWRLAHAHGTLLSLINVVFGLTLGSRFAPEPTLSERASRLLIVATLLLPGGFFLGGFFVHGGDPGLGVLLVPFGAFALLAGVFVTLRGLPQASVTAGAATPKLELREIEYGSPDYDQSVVLRLRVLRAPLGLWPGPEERGAEARLRHLAAFDGPLVVGCLMLEELGDGRVKMRQVAIDFSRQREGVGTRLVAFSEEVARSRGLREMRLHARRTAVPFYERLGYRTEGEPFVEVTLPHIAMHKSLV